VFGLRFAARIEKNLAAKTKLSIRLHLWVRNQSVKRESQHRNQAIKPWKSIGPSSAKIRPFCAYFSSVADPGSGALLTPGSGIWKKIWIRIRDEHSRSFF
jgi:hypothetical protein